MNEAAKPYRRWYQFSLRTLLVAFMVLGVPLSWFAARMERTRKQRKAVEAIQRLGGSVEYDRHMPSLTWLRCWLGNDFFDEVETVDVLNIQITDAGLEHLDGLTNLKRLSLDGTRITDGGLEHFRGLTNLQELNLLGSSKLTNADWSI